MRIKRKNHMLFVYLCFLLGACGWETSQPATFTPPAWRLNALQRDQAEKVVTLGLGVFDNYLEIPGFAKDSKELSHLKRLMIVGKECDATPSPCPKLKAIPPDLLDIKSLESLSILVQDIRALPTGLAHDLPHLNYLDLSHNFSLRLDWVQGLVGIDTVNLNECGLGDEHITAILQLNQAKALGLQGNRFTEEGKARLRELLPQAFIEN
jgi:hypothetical protein